MKRRLLFTLLLTAMLAACSTGTDPEEISCTLENDLALQTGNWWVYDVYDTDKYGQKIAGTERQDSTVVERTEIHNGRTAYMLVNYSTMDGGVTYTIRDTSWTAVEDNRAYKPALELAANYCRCFVDDWGQFADCGADNWRAFDKTIEESMPAQMPPDNIVSATYRLHFYTDVRREAPVTASVAGKQVQVRTFNVDSWVEGHILQPEGAVHIGSFGREFHIVNTVRFTLGEGIGIVTLERKAEQLLESEEWYPHGEARYGTVKHLIRYSVK